MAYKKEDLERVYCTCRAIFSGNDALLRKKKKVKEALIKNTTTVKPLFFSFGEEKTILMSQHLLECRVFESDLRAKVMFPSLFQSTPQQDADREASEADAVRSVANALDEMSQSEGEDDDDELDRIPESYPEEAVPTPIAEKVPEDAPPADAPLADAPLADEPLALVKAITPPQDLADMCDIDSGVTLTSPPPHPGLPSLYPACLPYKTQHDILTTTQRVLEECCFDFATKWIPHVLRSQGWDCARNRTGKHPHQGCSLPHTSVEAHCCAQTAHEKNVLENRTLFSLDDIRRQREELDRQEKQVIENMVREDRDHKALIGRLLEAAVDDI